MELIIKYFIALRFDIHGWILYMAGLMDRCNLYYQRLIHECNVNRKNSGRESQDNQQMANFLASRLSNPVIAATSMPVLACMGMRRSKYTVFK